MFEHIPKHQARALIVQEYGPDNVDALDWLQSRSERDPEVLDG